jgi:hypothetical protein
MAELIGRSRFSCSERSAYVFRLSSLNLLAMRPATAVVVVLLLAVIAIAGIIWFIRL